MMAHTTNQDEHGKVTRSPRIQRHRTTEQDPKNSLVTHVGMRIRDLRLKQGLSLRAFGKHGGLNPNHVMAIELGQMAANTTTLRAIAAALGVTAADLLNHGTDDEDLGSIAELLRTCPEVVPLMLARLKPLAIVKGRSVPKRQPNAFAPARTRQGRFSSAAIDQGARP
jgi:transcriptional regulator with XRE-family HTH domain